MGQQDLGAAQRIKMTPAQEAHLERIKGDFASWVDAKYRKGQAEHGPGNLLDHSVIHLIDEAIRENIDQFVYLVSAREKFLSEG